MPGLEPGIQAARSLRAKRSNPASVWTASPPSAMSARKWRNLLITDCKRVVGDHFGGITKMVDRSGRAKLGLPRASAFDDDGKSHQRLDLTMLRHVVLGYRWDGVIKISSNSIDVTTSGSLPGQDTKPKDLEAHRP
ncbi:MAG TPA: hypothetical protein VGL41_05955 [Roseiarcus sp.]|jgi:hypothetical protein